MARRRDPITNRLLLEGVHPRVSPKTGDVTYRARLSWGPRDRRRHESQTFSTAKAAEDWISALRADIRHGRRIDTADLTVADYHEQWLSRKRSIWSGSRTTTVKRVWRKYGNDFFGTMLISRVERHDVQRLIDIMTGDGLKTSSIQTYMVGIISMFDAAVQDGVLSRSPAHHLTYPRPDEVSYTTWSPLQMRRFVSRTRKDVTYGPLWALLIATGCRIGEALALEWSAVNLDDGVIAIHAHLARQEDGKYAVVRGTKTNRRGRSVPIERWMIDILQQCHERRQGPYVIHRDGEFLNPKTVHWRWHKAVKSCNLPAMRLHDVRHSVATAMLAAGVPQRVVQEILGHASIVTTMNTYAHVTIETQRQGTGALTHLLGFDDPDTTTRTKTEVSASTVRQSDSG